MFKKITLSSLIYHLIFFTFICFWANCSFSLTTRTWDGGAGTNDFNTAANWSGDILPSSTDSCVISLSASKTISLSGSITVGALYVAVSGNNNYLKLDCVSYLLTIQGNLHLVASSGNTNTGVELDLGSSAGGITVGRHAFIDYSGAKTAYIYADINSPGIFKFYGNLTVGSNGRTVAGYEPNLIFDATGSQTITLNGTGTYFLGENITFGSANNPVISVLGSSSFAFGVYDGNISINGTTNVDINSQTLDRIGGAGGTFSMAAGSTLKIGGTGDFPASFTTYSVNATSNTYYDGTTQNVTAISGGYGHVFIDGSNTKTLAASTVDINGNLTISAGTLSASTFLMTLAGHFTNNSTFSCGTGTITYDGSSNQNITGSSASTFYKMTVGNSAGITILKGATVNNLLTFSSGNITAASSTEPITIGVLGSVSGNADTKCVVGYCAKNTNTTSKFTFPVGTTTTQRTIAVTPSSTSATTWLTKYFATGYADQSITGFDLTRVSTTEYWTLDRTGSANSTIELSWDSASGVTDVSKVWVAHYDGADWEAASGEGGSGSTSAGTVTSTAGWSSYSPFTLGFSNAVPLPIEMLSFEGFKQKENEVLLKWVTASEINNDYFTLERSFDGHHFSPLTRIDGAGNSTHSINYSFVDNDAINGINYYKLIQTDFDGEETKTQIISVDMTKRFISIVKTVNSIGQEVNQHYSGVVYDVYSDGGIVKRLQ